jgi:hypothetical protein
MAELAQGPGVAHFFVSKIDELELTIREKASNLQVTAEHSPTFFWLIVFQLVGSLHSQRLTAQRNELNGRVRLLREELDNLHKPASYVGEIIKAMGKTKVSLVSAFRCVLEFTFIVN